MDGRGEVGGALSQLKATHDTKLTQSKALLVYRGMNRLGVEKGDYLIRPAVKWTCSVNVRSEIQVKLISHPSCPHICPGHMTAVTTGINRWHHRGAWVRFPSQVQVRREFPGWPCVPQRQTIYILSIMCKPSNIPSFVFIIDPSTTESQLDNNNNQSECNVLYFHIWLKAINDKLK